MPAPQAFTIDAKHRLRLPKAMLGGLWKEELQNGTLSLGIGLGSHGQLEVFSSEYLKKVVAKLLSDDPNDQTRFTVEKMFELNPMVENSRITITIPRELRVVDLAPSSGDGVLLFVEKNRIEIWKGQDWLRKTGPDLEIVKALLPE